MIVNFRQGIVQYPVGFLKKTGSPLGRYVEFSLPSGNSLIFNIADGDSDYLVVVKVSPGTNTFGPFTAGVDYWMYVDVNKDTGLISYGSTTLQPFVSSTRPKNIVPFTTQVAPSAPLAVGRMWFKAAPDTPAEDLTYPPYQMYLCTAVSGSGPSAVATWERVIRVVVAKYEDAALFSSVSINAGSPNASVRFAGTQAGLLATNLAVGEIIYSDGVAVVRPDGKLLTTEDALTTGTNVGTNVKIAAEIVTGVANVSFPAYTVVRFTDFGKVSPVNIFSVDQSFAGMVEAAATAGQEVQIVRSGIITNAAWDWSQVNLPLYVDNSGQLTETFPSVNDARPIGYVLSKDQVVLAPAFVEVGLVDHATETEFGAVRLDAPPMGVAGYVEFDFGGTLVGGNPSGLVNTNTYTGEMVVNGVTIPVGVPPIVLPVAPTVNDVITALNTQLSGNGVAALNAGNLRVTSVVLGPGSTVRVSDAGIFESMTGFVEVDTPVDGYWDSVVASAVGIAAHIADLTVHMTPNQNVFMDALNLPTLLGSDVNQLAGITVVPNTRSINTTAGELTGGGALSSNLTLGLAATAVTPASYGSATSVGTFTVDARGRLTAAADATISIPESAVVNLGTDLASKYDEIVAVNGNFPAFATLGTTLVDSGVSPSSFAAASHLHAAGDVTSGTFADARIAASNVTQHVASIDHDLLLNYAANDHVDHSTVSVTAGTGLSGGGAITSSVTLNLAATAVSAGSYGSASQVGTFTVDAQGRLTAAANTSISITASQVSDFTSASQAVPHPITTQATPYAASATDRIILATGTGNVTLPAPATGKEVVVKNVGVGVVTVVPNAVETIDGGPSFGLPVQYDTVTVVSDGTNWFVI